MSNGFTSVLSSKRCKASLGVVAIGRNEGDRLRRCLASLSSKAAIVVYVDSGSQDDSVEFARTMGCHVVELDLRMPFTAARARNEGFDRLVKMMPDVHYVQFVDGDCEVVPGWLEDSLAFMETHADAAVVCGRRRERFPQQSIYNMLCDIEWDSPVGEAKACGGDALMRTDAFRAMGGYRPDLIAGEEPELCVRLRAAGWRIWRIDRDMTLHDAAMQRFGQWWNRMLRCGYAFAQGSHIHGAPPERHRVRETRRAWLWGLVMPAAILGLAVSWSPWALVLVMIYPLQVVRLALRGRRSPKENWLHALFLVVGRFPEACGQLKFAFHNRLGSQSRLIEYK